MSNGARHTWGFFAGVVLTAALAGLLIYGSYRLQHGYPTQFRKQDKWIGGGLLLAAAIIFAILVASRLSPVASLVGGIALTAAGVLFFVSQKTTADLINRFPFKGQRVTLAGLEEEGFILFAGVGLLFASLFPSRWRGGDEDDEYAIPEPRTSRDMYHTSDSAGDPLAGHYSISDRQPAEQSPYAPQHGPSQPSAYERTSYDSPLHEPTQQQYGRSPYNPPPEEGGSTREMRRPE